MFDRKAWWAANKHRYAGRDRRAYRKAYYAANKEKMNAVSRAYRAAHKEQLNDYLRAYRLTHKDKRDRSGYYSANKTKINAGNSVWKRLNPARVAAISARRRARVTSSVCKCCKGKEFVALYGLARWLRLEVDHVRPISKGGAHCMLNLQLIPRPENLRKNAKWTEAA